jgi:hypothetical protein
VRIVFRQAGGFAGLIRGVELDSEELPPDQRRALEAFLGSSKPEGLAAHSPATRDALTYRLRIERPSGSVAFAFDEPNLPPELESLVDFLQSRLRPCAPE